MKKPKPRTLIWYEKTKTPNPKIVSKNLNPEPRIQKIVSKDPNPESAPNPKIMSQNPNPELAQNPKNMIFDEKFDQIL